MISSPHDRSTIASTRLQDTAAQLLEVERTLCELWLEQLPDIRSDQAEDLVAAHRSVHFALAAIRRAGTATHRHDVG